MLIHIILLQLIGCTLESSMLKEINKIRKKYRMEELYSISALEKAADLQAKFMCTISRLTHEGSNDETKTLAKRLKKNGFEGVVIGENIAKQRDKDYKEVIRLWMNSEEHKKNILGDYSYSSVSTCKDEHGNRYWVQVFGKDISNNKILCLRGKINGLGQNLSNFDDINEPNDFPSKNDLKNLSRNDIDSPFFKEPSNPSFETGKNKTELPDLFNKKKKDYIMLIKPPEYAEGFSGSYVKIPDFKKPYNQQSQIDKINEILNSSDGLNYSVYPRGYNENPNKKLNNPLRGPIAGKTLGDRLREILDAEQPGDLINNPTPRDNKNQQPPGQQPKSQEPGVSYKSAESPISQSSINQSQTKTPESKQTASTITLKIAGPSESSVAPLLKTLTSLIQNLNIAAESSISLNNKKTDQNLQTTKSLSEISLSSSINKEPASSSINVKPTVSVDTSTQPPVTSTSTTTVTSTVTSTVTKSPETTTEVRTTFGKGSFFSAPPLVSRTETKTATIHSPVIKLKTVTVTKMVNPKPEAPKTKPRNDENRKAMPPRSTKEFEMLDNLNNNPDLYKNDPNTNEILSKIANMLSKDPSLNFNPVYKSPKESNYTKPIMPAYDEVPNYNEMPNNFKNQYDNPNRSYKPQDYNNNNDPNQKSDPGVQYDVNHMVKLLKNLLKQEMDNGNLQKEILSNYESKNHPSATTLHINPVPSTSPMDSNNQKGSNSNENNVSNHFNKKSNQQKDSCNYGDPSCQKSNANNKINMAELKRLMNDIMKSGKMHLHITDQNTNCDASGNCKDANTDNIDIGIPLSLTIV